jgi:hypothetical protein
LCETARAWHNVSLASGSAPAPGGADRLGQGRATICCNGGPTTGSIFSYLAYGLRIHTSIPLPELVAEGGEREVSIRLGRVEHPQFSETPEADSAFFSPTPEEDYVFFREVGSFLVRGGNEIVVDPSPGLDERVLRLLLIGPVMAVLLRQRGHLVLHASAVAVAGAAILFLGSSGRGKSTTAAALRARGHRLVTDDVAVLRVEESPPLVYPSFPHLKLWPDALVSLGDDPETLPQWNPYLEKRARPAATEFSSTPLPVKKIYILDEGDALRLFPLTPQEAFLEVARHTYGSDYGLQPAMGLGSASHFFKCQSIIDKVAVRSLIRQKYLSQLPNLVRLIEEDSARDTEGAPGAK